MGETILQTENLKKYFPVKRSFFSRERKWIRAVDGVDLELEEGEILGVVGESGSGKTTLAKMIQGIYRPTEGAVRFRGVNIHTLAHHQMKDIRREIQYVYQNPGGSFDPWWMVGKSLEEPLKIHQGLSNQEIKKRVKEILKAVGLGEDHLFRYPHEFSGGQQRRLALARVLILSPSLVIFDEPTSGLDVSIQATILKLLKQLRDDLGLTYIFISHDLSVVQMMSDKIAVMYLGAMVEFGHTKIIFNNPRHPYTKSLLAAAPRIEDAKIEKDNVIKGEVPNPIDIPSGCRFWPRCPNASGNCTHVAPISKLTADGRKVTCHLA
ncbi:MAG: oligopeptide/dipeptide ABC transporter ATP-binding protein [Thermodesulfobacteriota bacterium]